MLKKADLHVHSKYSEHPSEWFLQRIGAGESYSEPEYIYKLAKQKGMNFVTITDHNRIEGILQLMEKHPYDTFTGVECTAYFPEDGCKVHILIYGFKEKQFNKIQKLRKNIYELRDYLKEKDLAHSVAHSNYSVNGKLKKEHFEKLILMFDVFEGINGGRSLFNNQSVQDVINNLSPEKIVALSEQYDILPFGIDSWKKGKTAGSDDHAGLFIGRTYSIAEDAESPEEFLQQLKSRKLAIEGRNNDYTSLAFMIYKIAWDYSVSKSARISKNLFSSFNQLLFEPKSLGFVDKIKLKGINFSTKNEDIITKNILELINKLEKNKDDDPGNRFGIVYDSVNKICDEIIIDIINYFRNNIDDLSIMDIISKISSFLPAAFLSIPFISSFNHLFGERELIRNIRKSFGLNEEIGKKRILWFTDTINDLNGVSVNLQEIARISNTQGLDITIAYSFGKDENRDIVPSFLDLPPILSFKAPYYDTYTIKVPSFLDSLKRIYELNPTDIYISTPGFVGVIGILAAKLLHIPSYGIFHTDFKLQLDAIVDDDSLGGITETFIKWFYNNCDYIAAPTEEYLKVLEDYGFDRKTFKIFKKWISPDIFRPIPNARQMLQQQYGINGLPLLLFTGRISQDKKIDNIIEIHKHLIENGKDNYLMIVGDGPYLDELKNSHQNNERIIFTGKKDREELAAYYSGSDIFIFPSESDTFGMSVMEASACGLPCIVSDKGGPKEIVLENKTGFIIPSGDIDSWVEKIDLILNWYKNNSKEIVNMKYEAINHIHTKYNIKEFFPNFISEPNEN